MNDAEFDGVRAEIYSQLTYLKALSEKIHKASENINNNNSKFETQILEGVELLVSTEELKGKEIELTITKVFAEYITEKLEKIHAATNGERKAIADHNRILYIFVGMMLGFLISGIFFFCIRF